MLVYILGSILLIVLIILGVKLVNTVNRLNVVLDDLDAKIKKFDNAFHFVDLFADNMALIGDKIIDGTSYLIRKVFNKNKKGKEEIENE